MLLSCRLGQYIANRKWSPEAEFAASTSRKGAGAQEGRLPCSSVPRVVLREDSCDCFSLNEFTRLVEMVVHDGARIDANTVVDRRQEFLGVHGMI